jgi:hypothetical protein
MNFEVISLLCGSAGNDDVQIPWTVHALDSIEFDVRGRGRAGNPGQWAFGVLRQYGDGLGEEMYHLVNLNHAYVGVWDEGYRPASLIRLAVQHDSSGVGARYPGRCDDCINLIEFIGCQEVRCAVGHDRDSIGNLAKPISG